MPDLELRVWGLRSLVIGRLMLYKSFYPSGPQFPHSQNVNSRKISNEESPVHRKVVFKWLLASYKLTWEFRC